MKKYKSISVFGTNYKIDKIEANLFTDNLQWGLISYGSQTISIKGDLGKENYEVTLLHELMHAINNTLHIELSEKQVELLASGLYATFNIKPLQGSK